MRRPASGFDADAQRAFGGHRLTALGRLAVDQKTIPVRDRIRGFRAVTPVLLADHVEHPDVRQAFFPQLLCGEDLSRDHPFRVACAAPSFHEMDSISISSRVNWKMSIRLRVEDFESAKMKRDYSQPPTKGQILSARPRRHALRRRSFSPDKKSRERWPTDFVKFS